MPFEEQSQPEKEDSANTKVVKRDRKLGDEWADWDGVTKETAGYIAHSKITFLALSLIIALVMSAAVIVFRFLIEPRVVQLPSLLRYATDYILLAIAALPFVLYLLLLLQTQLNLSILPYAINERFLLFLIPKSIWVGKWFGLSRDKVSHSFILVNNAITSKKCGQNPENKLLVLLPRCLQPTVRKEIKVLTEQYPCHLGTADGGEEARELVRRHHPDVIIAVACERDLLTGIKDVALAIPVIGVPNRRPEGPCKNTLIQKEDFEQALTIVFGASQRK
jgi:uncharacterized protein